jgi:GAF domain-containing protein
MEIKISPEQGAKNEKYQFILQHLPALIGSETDVVANMANLVALLKESFGFFWVGFYIVKDNQLVLGPFQGPVACTRIAFGKGVCGGAWAQKKTLVVEDVHQFPGHIACSEHSKSEVVVPVFRNGEVIAVLDIDSQEFATFDSEDAVHLEKLMEWFAPYM